MDLLTSLRLHRLPSPPRIALVGAGGKTTAMFLLARQLLEQFQTVLISATTHLAPEQAQLADHHHVVLGQRDLEALFPLPGVQLITGSLEGAAGDAPSRLQGLDPAFQIRLLSLADAYQLPLLVEADGSRRLPLKAPAVHEPAVPSFVDRVIVVAGLSGLGRPLDSASVHRPERFAELSGLLPGQPVSAQALASVLAHPQGGLKNIPPGAQPILLLNQVEDPAQNQAAGWLAERMLPHFSPVLIAALVQPGAPVYAAWEPVAGIVLAAGEGRRFVDRSFDRPKQLLQWGGEPLVRRAARIAIEAGLNPVRVVVGARAAEVAAALQGLPVEIILNSDWAAGQSTSLKAGLARLPGATGAALFLLCDQPFITSDLLLDLRRKHAETLAPLIAPWCGGRRANPALFDRRTFPDLLSLSGDAGGRLLFNMPERYSPAWLPWSDERLLMDVDTLEDYRRLKEMSA